MSILSKLDLQDWQQDIDAAQQQQAITCLEQGSILFFPNLTFALKRDEEILLSPTYGDGKAKNISYNCKDHSLRGIDGDEMVQKKITSMMSRFNRYSHALLNKLFPNYALHLQVARTSYRPVEIAGRRSKSYKKDDTRLHVDAFPSNPVQGRRILRVFSNVNPHGQARVWRAGESFTQVAQRFLPQVTKPLLSGEFLKKFGLTKSLRTPYDHIMLQIHDRMKADMNYQKEVDQTEIQFPAGSTWIVQTDSVSHAALAGQFVLEQTFYLPVMAMANEDLSPLRILENLSGRSLV